MPPEPLATKNGPSGPGRDDPAEVSVKGGLIQTFAWILMIPFVFYMASLAWNGIFNGACPGAIEPSYQECDRPIELYALSVETIDTSTPAGQTRMAAKAYGIQWATAPINYSKEQTESLVSGRDRLTVWAIQDLSDEELDDMANTGCESLRSAATAEDFTAEQARSGARGTNILRTKVLAVAVPIYCPEHNALIAEVVGE